MKQDKTCVYVFLEQSLFKVNWAIFSLFHTNPMMQYHIHLPNGSFRFKLRSHLVERTEVQKNGRYETVCFPGTILVLSQMSYFQPASYQPNDVISSKYTKELPFSLS
jgi:hypothetical protein